MKALLIGAHGDTPTVQEVPRPVPGPDEVLVEVAGAALNPLDLKLAAGHMQDYFPISFPYTIGTDITGTVVEVGGDARGRVDVGQRVMARLDPTAGGGVAEYALVLRDQVVDAPHKVPLEVATGAVTAAATAWQALTEVAQVEPGQRVLVHAAAGGVGSFAVQLAKRLSCYVVATASGSGLQIARDLGADEVVDRAAAPFTEQVRDIDVVIDTVGGDVERDSLTVLRPGGLLVAVPRPPDEARAHASGMRAVFFSHISDAERLRTVAALLDDGLRIVVDRTSKIEQAPQALEHLATGHARGKVIVVF